jgi:ferredoxin--NADP+ reductase
VIILYIMLNATLIKRIQVTPDLLILRITPDSGVPDFKPGQYVALGLPSSAARYLGAPPERAPQEGDKLIKRAYSIGSSPSQRDYLEFYIAVVPDGGLTSRLAALTEGDRLFAQPKVTGTFTLDGVAPDRNLILVSTGTGLAPFMAMIRTNDVWSAGRDITVVHGVRYPSDFAYADELSGYQEARGLRYLPIASRSGIEYSGAKGRVQALFEGGVLKPEPSRDSVFLCGNPAMIEDLERYLTQERGFTVHSKKTPGDLHIEKYW